LEFAEQRNSNDSEFTSIKGSGLDVDYEERIEEDLRDELDSNKLAGNS
jgi:hypothetical protein